MSQPRPAQQKLTDAQVREILSHPETSAAEFGRRYGVCANSVLMVRNRRSYRAIKAARELGLIARSPRRVCVASAASRHEAIADGYLVPDARAAETLA